MTEQAPGPVRQTRQRTAVKAALEGRDGFMSAQQLHDVLRQQGDSVGLTTVYRSLQALAAAIRTAIDPKTEAKADDFGRRIRAEPNGCAIAADLIERLAR